MVKYQQGQDLVHISLRFPRELWKKLRLKAIRDDTTATNIVVKLVQKHLSRKSAGKEGTEK